LSAAGRSHADRNALKVVLRAGLRLIVSTARKGADVFASGGSRDQRRAVFRRHRRQRVQIGALVRRHPNDAVWIAPKRTTLGSVALDGSRGLPWLGRSIGRKLRTNSADCFPLAVCRLLRIADV
jgi:hypothetical protein